MSTGERRVIRKCCGRDFQGWGAWSSHQRWHGRMQVKQRERLHETAFEHAAADRDCGREWVCACGACKEVRSECADGKEGRSLLSSPAYSSPERRADRR